MTLTGAGTTANMAVINRIEAVEKAMEKKLDYDEWKKYNNSLLANKRLCDLEFAMKIAVIGMVVLYFLVLGPMIPRR